MTQDQEKENKFIYQNGRDIVKMAFQKHLGSENQSQLDESSLDLMLSFLPIKVEPLTKYESISLIDLVNLTDFVDVSRILGLNEQDQVMSSLEKIKAEKSVVQELYNFNFQFQRPQPSCGLRTPNSANYSMDHQNQFHDISTINEYLGVSSDPTRPNADNKLSYGPLIEQQPSD